MRIGFFLRHRFHSAIMEPIYNHPKDRFDCRLFSSQPLPFALPPGKRVVLYAPTFQASLSSARLLGERTVELLRWQRQDVTIIIKPPPLIGNLFPQWLEQWQRLAAEEPDVHLVQDTHSGGPGTAPTLP